MAPHLSQYAIIFLSVAAAGAAVTATNPMYGGQTVRHPLRDADASIPFIIPMFAATALAAAEETKVAEVIIIGDALPGTTSMADRLGEPIKQVPVDVATHTMLLPYSSATTGLPKRSMLSHRNLMTNIEQSIRAIRYQENEVALAASPFSTYMACRHS